MAADGDRRVKDGVVWGRREEAGGDVGKQTASEQMSVLENHSAGENKATESHSRVRLK